MFSGHEYQVRPEPLVTKIEDNSSEDQKEEDKIENVKNTDGTSDETNDNKPKSKKGPPPMLQRQKSSTKGLPSDFSEKARRRQFTKKDFEKQDKYGETLLTDAVLRQDHVAVQQILDITNTDVAINTPNNAGITPLHWAVCKNDVEMVRLLLSLIHI